MRRMPLPEENALYKSPLQVMESHCRIPCLDWELLGGPSRGFNIESVFNAQSKSKWKFPSKVSQLQHSPAHGEEESPSFKKAIKHELVWHLEIIYHL